jgi:opacity protein-like surface antigen
MRPPEYYEWDFIEEAAMHTKWVKKVFLSVGWAALSCAVAGAQTDVALSLYGAFTGTTNANGVTQSPANAAGGLLEVRHIVHPWMGFEGTYAFNRANQAYSGLFYPPVTSCIAGSCGPATEIAAVSANAHEVTGDWVASLKVGNLRPFALAGGGILFDAPSGQILQSGSVIMACGGTNPSCTNTTTKPVFVYGGGVDWGLLPHLGLRFQYRGNLYKAPALTTVFTSTGAFTHTAEPMIGVYFRL